MGKWGKTWSIQLSGNWSLGVKAWISSVSISLTVKAVLHVSSSHEDHNSGEQKHRKALLFVVLVLFYDLLK